MMASLCSRCGDQSDFSLERIGVSAQGIAFDEHFTGVRAQQAGDNRDCSSFPGAVRSEQTDGLPSANPQVDTVDGN
jgi:hypothetical protein